MDKQSKLKNAIKLTEAIKSGNESFVLLKRIDDLEEKIEGIKIPESKDEEIEITLDII